MRRLVPIVLMMMLACATTHGQESPDVPAAAPDIVGVLKRSQQRRLDAMPLADAAGARARRVQDSFTILVRHLPALPPAELRVVRGDLIAETLHGRIVAANESLADLTEGTRLFVLAHELGHVMLGHWSETGLLYRKWVPGAVVPSETDPVAGPLGREGSQQAWRQEFEADAFALRTLRSLGWNERDVMAAFMQLGVRHDSATHPGTRKRVAALRSAFEH